MASSSDNEDYNDQHFNIEWEESPDWLRKTLTATGFGMLYFTTKQALRWKEIEVFLPPRAVVLPAPYQKGYLRVQRMRSIIASASRETATAMFISGSFYYGAFRLGEYRGQHNWENFAASGGAVGFLCSAFLPAPLRFAPRATAFLTCLGVAAGVSQAKLAEAVGLPLWNEKESKSAGAGTSAATTTTTSS